MTAPRFLPCRCGHDKAAHENADFAPQCVGAGCGCVQYRVPTAAPDRPTGAHTPPASRPAQPAPPPPPGLAPVRPLAQSLPQEIVTPQPSEPPRRTLIETGVASTNPKIKKLAERIRGDLATLGELLDGDEDAAAARAEVAELEKKLAEARARAFGTSVSAPVQCPKCGETVSSAGLTMHQWRSKKCKAAS